MPLARSSGWKAGLASRGEFQPTTLRRASMHNTLRWSATAEGPAVWRFALTDVYSRQRRAFGELKEVIAFLQSRMEGGEADKVKREA